jgi:adenylate cyclase
MARTTKMGIEIERKFLVKSNEWRKLITPYLTSVIMQGYFGVTPEGMTMRIRIVNGNHAYLTLKSMNAGMERRELEYDIPLQDAIKLMAQSTKLISKVRYRISIRVGEVWEIDEFLGGKYDHCIAEIELNTVDQEITLPSWIGVEVTSVKELYNEDLAGDTL